jgi:response regulator of citrate/malate metabolism
VPPEKAKGLGIKDYLIKPLGAEEFHQAIRRVLDSRTAGGELV